MFVFRPLIYSEAMVQFWELLVTNYLLLYLSYYETHFLLGSMLLYTAIWRRNMCLNVIYESFYCFHIPHDRFILFSSIPLIFTSNSSQYRDQDVCETVLPTSNFVGLIQLLSALHVTYRLTLRRLSYIYGAPILDVSRSHTTTQHSR